jgi:hypothetical protein
MIPILPSVRGDYVTGKQTPPKSSSLFCVCVNLCAYMCAHTYVYVCALTCQILVSLVHDYNSHAPKFNWTPLKSCKLQI